MADELRGEEGEPDDGIRRLVVLGASNVTLAFPLIATACLNSSISRGVELFAAQGHGRSFCQRSFVLNRGLPSLLECGLWEDLSSRPPATESWGLLTDVGNDLIYGLSVDHVARQVEQAIQNLHQLGIPLTYVPPPLERILQLNHLRYRVIKSILFPGPTVPWKIISQRIVELNDRVIGMVESIGGQVIPPSVRWYGIDPIHVRPTSRVEAWQTILNHWPFAEPPDVRWPGMRNASRFWKLAPQERSYGKRSRRTPQPVLSLPDRKTIWLY